MPGPATPCAVWVGAYNSCGKTALRRSRPHQRRPIVRPGGKAHPPVYVAQALLVLAGVVAERPDQVQACHTCPTGSAWHGFVSCVDLDHLRWGTQSENEADKYD